MLYFLLFMKPYPFLSYQLHSLSFPKYTNCFQSTDFFITAYCMLFTASFLYWILDWTSILNLTWTVIAHIKQIKAANLFLEGILYIHYHWRVPRVYLLRRNGGGENDYPGRIKKTLIFPWYVTGLTTLVSSMNSFIEIVYTQFQNHHKCLFTNHLIFPFGLTLIKPKNKVKSDFYKR